MPEQRKSANEFAMAHWEFVSKEYTEYFGMYMRSWSILGSAIIVGAIIGLAKADGTSSTDTTLAKVVVCTIPLLIAVWFVVTSWFWAYFAMYRTYLVRLEDDMSQSGKEHRDLVSFHKYRESWFHRKVQRPATVLVGVLAVLVYLVLAFTGSWLLLGDPASTDLWLLLKKRLWWCLMTVYALILAASIWLALSLSWNTPEVPQEGKLGGTQGADNDTARIQGNS